MGEEEGREVVERRKESWETTEEFDLPLHVSSLGYGNQIEHGVKSVTIPTGSSESYWVPLHC
jgi:hypothetical protein